MSLKAFKIWGTKETILSTKKFVIDRLKLIKNSFCSWHYHKKKANFFYCVSGCIDIVEERGTIRLNPGESAVIYPDFKHQFRAIEDSEMLEVAWVDGGEISEEDINRLVQGGQITYLGDTTEDKLRELGMVNKPTKE